MPAEQSVGRGSRPDQRFPRRERLHRQRDFSHLRRSGSRQSSRHLVMLFERGGEFPMMGIAVGRMVGPAVVRAKIRRRIREQYRRHRFELRPARMLFMARRGCAEASYQTLGEEMKQLWRASGLWKES